MIHLLIQLSPPKEYPLLELVESVTTKQSIKVLQHNSLAFFTFHRSLTASSDPSNFVHHFDQFLTVNCPLIPQNTPYLAKRRAQLLTTLGRISGCYPKIVRLRTEWHRPPRRCRYTLDSTISSRARRVLCEAHLLIVPCLLLAAAGTQTRGSAGVAVRSAGE